LKEGNKGWTGVNPLNWGDGGNTAQGAEKKKTHREIRVWCGHGVWRKKKKEGVSVKKKRLGGKGGGL